MSGPSVDPHENPATPAATHPAKGVAVSVAEAAVGGVVSAAVSHFTGRVTAPRSGKDRDGADTSTGA